jgi:hypothetical protein
MPRYPARARRTTVSDRESQAYSVPNKSGAGMYVVGALALAGGIGAILFFTKGSEPKPEPPKPITTGQPIQAAPPPPPPPPPPPSPTAEPTASAASSSDAKADATGKPGAGGPSPCSACNAGTPSSALNSALAGAAGQARSCYNKALQRDSGAGGQLTVSVRVGPSGQVCGASVSNDTTGGGISSCVLQKFQGRTFPPPTQGCATVNIPISFSVKE